MHAGDYKSNSHWIQNLHIHKNLTNNVKPESKQYWAHMWLDITNWVFIKQDFKTWEEKTLQFFWEVNGRIPQDKQQLQNPCFLVISISEHCPLRQLRVKETWFSLAWTKGQIGLRTSFPLGCWNHTFGILNSFPLLFFYLHVLIVTSQLY